MKRFFTLISLVFLFVSCQQIDSFLGIETKIKKEKPVDKSRESLYNTKWP